MRAQGRKAKRKILGIIDAHGEAKTGPCEICAKECKLVLDHDHLTGRIRGWLCDRCNKGLGSFNDNLESLRNATTYLEKSKP